MSDAKKPVKASDTKRIMDVAHPGRSAPSSTSKPVIVTNRPVLQDPMMVGAPDGVTGSDTKILSTPGKIKIQPLTAPEVKQEVGVKHDETPAEVPAEPAPQEAAPAAAEKPAEKPVEQPAEEAKEESKPEAEKSAQLSSETTAPDAKEAAPATETDEKPASDDEPGAEKKEAEAADETEPSEPQEKPEGDKAVDDATAKAAEEAAKHDAAIQALSDSKKYYLPVNSVEKRRTKRVVALGIILSVLLALAWVDIALDAGLIQVNGVKPVTHFFSN